jgi:hypothetical protein
VRYKFIKWKSTACGVNRIGLSSYIQDHVLQREAGVESQSSWLERWKLGEESCCAWQPKMPDKQLGERSGLKHSTNSNSTTKNKEPSWCNSINLLWLTDTFFFFCGTGDWTQGPTLARQALYHFCFGYFEDGVLLFSQASPVFFPIKMGSHKLLLGLA